MHLLSNEDVEVSPLSLTLRFCMTASVLTLNTAEIWILSRGQRKTFQNVLISLSAADLLLGISSLLDCFATIYHWQRASKLISISSFYYFMLVSILHLIFISLDRLCAIAFPHNYKQFCRKRKLALGLLASWVLPLLALMCQFLVNYCLGQHGWGVLHGFNFDSSYWLNIVIALADVLFIVTYIAIFCLIRRRNVSTYQHSQIDSSARSHALLLCICTVLAFMTCTSPFLVAHIRKWNKPDWLGILYRNSLIANSTINPLIFLVRYRIQKKASTKNFTSTKNNTISLMQA